MSLLKIEEPPTSKVRLRLGIGIHAALVYYAAIWIKFGTLTFQYDANGPKPPTDEAVAGVLTFFVTLGVVIFAIASVRWMIEHLKGGTRISWIAAVLIAGPVALAAWWWVYLQLDDPEDL